MSSNGGSLIQPIKDGQIQETSAQASMKKSRESSNDAYSKDTFLQLLVAEVKYQDPLQPTSNTEWISQYATFSQLESMQNMSAAYDLSRASALVGQTAVMKVTESGSTEMVQGNVDYVTYEGNKAYLSINGSLYSIDDLYNVVDPTYLAASDKAYNWTVELNKLPSLTNLTLDDREAVERLSKEFKDFSEYEQSFIVSDNQKKIEAYSEKMKELIAIAEEDKKAAEKAEEEKKEENDGNED